MGSNLSPIRFKLLLLLLLLLFYHCYFILTLWCGREIRIAVLVLLYEAFLYFYNIYNF